ncbi:ABC transporter permease [Paenibacillus sp. NPDC057967]|uniref:ABC transporter permease n=1 Tax=Paenibacillus sp. NPDC057967 TaxID=3346293 RepID=UPI0036DD7E56
MNIWRIAVKELMTFRDVRMLVFMLATPVLLMLIMGSLLSSAFNASVAIGDIRVIYSDNSEDGAIGANWELWLSQSGTEHMVFEKFEGNDSEAMEGVRDGSYSGYAALNPSGVHYYGNSRSSVENSMVSGILSAFADRYKLSLAGAAPEPESMVQGSYVKETLLQGSHMPGAMDYFAIAVTTMIILYSAATAGNLIDSERTRNTAIRLLASPISKGEIFVGKILGTMVLHAAFVALIMLISKYMYNANWGDNLPMVWLVLLSEIAFALSLGLGISYIVKGKASGIVIMTIIQLACFFGGSYYRIEDNGDFVSKLAPYSPLTWSNEALMDIIYGGETGTALTASALNLGVAAAMLLIAAVMMRRREGL